MSSKTAKVAAKGKASAIRWSLGGTSAEADPLLDEAFVDNGVYARLCARDDFQWFVIGRTGSGKSALLRRLEQERAEHTVRLNPRQLAFQHITNLNAIRELLGMGVRLEPFFHALWKHLILCEVIRHRYTNPSEEVKRGLFERLRATVRRSSRAGPKGLEYVDQLEAQFWDTAEEQVRQQVDSLVTRVTGAAGATADVKVARVGGGVSADRVHTAETYAELKDRFQRIVNEDVVIRLNSVIRELADTTLGSTQHFTYVLIDDLDLTWVEDDVANLLIKCLLQVALELQPTRYLKVVIALRTNIFEQLNVGNQARGGQEEKLRAASIVLRWTRSDLEQVVARRLAVEAGRQRVAEPLLATVLPGAVVRGISPLAYILNRTLLRPRDVIMYFNRCLEASASPRPKISWNTIRDVEPSYSRDRLAALRDEWNDPYFGIDRVFECFRRRPWTMDLALIDKVCEDIALLLVETIGDRGKDPGEATQGFRGAHWLTTLCEPMWRAGADRVAWQDRLMPVLGLLFDVGFIGFASNTRHDAVYGTDPTADLRDLVARLGPADHPEFSVHPAFRLALQMIPPRSG